MKRTSLALVATLAVLTGGAVAQDTTAELWLPTLVTANPQEGFDLAVRLARTGVRLTQPDVEVLRKLRPEYANDADSLIASSQVIAVHFQTIAAANDYWRPAP